MLELTRDITLEECDWLDTTFKKGDKVHRFTGSTYGCISYSGVDCSVDGKNPFF
tara:strand:- start:231 stop:392 length:162 start_codon:yes stop_codon:yes gene_type:complete